MSDETPIIDPVTRDLLALFLVPGLGPQKTRVLLNKFGSVQNVLQASASELAQIPGIGSKTADQIKKAVRENEVDAEIKRLQEHRTKILRGGTRDFPAPLKDIDDRPMLLYCRGDYEPRDEKAVAIVGSRQCTAYGKRIAERLAADLVRRGYTVISGLARGVDGYAHRGALQAKGRTIAVLAGGLANIYPPEHKKLAEEVEVNGCLLTEAPMTRQPLPGMFPVRNRIISGLAKGVIIVEAPQKSGALITADLAAEQGRDVFAVPGPVDSAASAGTLNLIRLGAKMIRHADDVVEDLEGIPLPTSPARATRPVVEKAPPPDLNENQQRIYDLLKEQALALDSLAQKLQIAVPQLAQELMMMEMKRCVRRLPGNQYERV